jgi:hypothetical protein
LYLHYISIDDEPIDESREPKTWEEVEDTINDEEDDDTEVFLSTLGNDTGMQIAREKRGEREEKEKRKRGEKREEKRGEKRGGGGHDQ